MKLKVIECMALEEGLFTLGEKEFPVKTSLKIHQALTNLEPVMKTIQQTAQPILQKEPEKQETELAKLHEEEMTVPLPQIDVTEFYGHELSARTLSFIRPILLIEEEEGIQDEN